MATFGQMKQWVSKRLQDPNNTAVSSDDVGEAINQAIDYWKKRRFYFNEITDTDTLTQSDTEIPLPADYLVPSLDNAAFVIEYSGIRYPLLKVSEPLYNAMYLSNGVGQPTSYARLANSEYHCYPIPDRAYTIRRFYLRDYDELSSDSDTNDWTTEAEDLTRYTALAYLSRDLRQDLSMYDAFNREAQDEYQNLLVQTRKANATGTLTTYSPLITY